MESKIAPLHPLVAEPAEPTGVAEIEPPILEVQHLSLSYGKHLVLKDVTLPIRRRAVTALIGPSGCGKSSFLRCLNRMNDFVPNAQITGKILFHQQDIYSAKINPIRVRRYIGMVFQRSNPFSQSIFDNVAYGLRLHRLGNKSEIADQVEISLNKVGLWQDVKDRLGMNALNLSGGQQQRVCLARAISVNPQVLLMDEPASALDPGAAEKIEDLIQELKQEYTIVQVTHNLQQAGRLSDFAGFFEEGNLIEFDTAEVIFSKPRHHLTEAYIYGGEGASRS